MNEYVCRWCGEGFAANHNIPPPIIGEAHRYCLSALAVMPGDLSLESLLEDAVERELHRT